MSKTSKILVGIFSASFLGGAVYGYRKQSLRLDAS